MKEDIFTYNDSYVKVYKNSSVGGELSFQLEKSALISDLGPILSAVIISEVDIPSFVDVDGDNDIDILTFKQSGGYIEYHQNQSQELYGNCDSLIFELKTDCWGEFFEGLNTYEFNTCGENASVEYSTTQIRSSGAHKGSTLLSLDIDGDNDMDIVLGDVSFNNLNLLSNGGDVDYALMNVLTQEFPIGNGSNVEANINSFPAAYYLDVNNDNIRDLVVSPNTDNNSENFESIMVFVNTQMDNNPSFEFSQNNFLQDNTLDLGSGAYPSFIDYNNDGLKDLLIGNYGYFNNGNAISQLALFRNIGSQNDPNFELIDRDFGNLSSIALDTILNLAVSGLFPTFADLDNDNDIDMIVGDNNGKIHYFKNNANIGENVEFELENVNFSSIDIGQHSTPFLYDMNGDNLFDLIIGQLNGTLSYVPNTGTENNPVFTTIENDFGAISVNNDESLYGFSTPYVYEENGELQILVGSESGKIYHFQSVNMDLNTPFTLISDNFQGLSQGYNTAVVYEDLTADGKRDLILGMKTGGILYFKNDSVSSNVKTYNNKNITVYPNPTNNILNINTEKEVVLSIYSTLGQLVLVKKVNGSSAIDVSHLVPSYYLVSIQYEDHLEWEKIIIKKGK